MQDATSPLALRVLAWLFTHREATTADIARAFDLSHADALALLPQVHAHMDVIMARYPNPADFADAMLTWLAQQSAQQSAQQRRPQQEEAQ